MTQQKCVHTSFSHLHLDLINCEILESYQTVIEYIYSIITLLQFTSLHIDFHYFSISILMELLCLLPNLDSLTVTSQLREKTKILSEEQNKMIHRLSIQNKITKVNLEQMTELDQVHILLDLCSHMHVLQVKCRNIVDAKWLIQYVLQKRSMKFVAHLCSIVLWIPEANDELMNNIKMIIDTGKLLDNYTIKRVYDKIYLRWN